MAVETTIPPKLVSCNSVPSDLLLIQLLKR